MTDDVKPRLRPAPEGVVFVRNRAEKLKVFQESVREIREEYLAQGRMTATWQRFFDKALAPDGEQETLWEDFFAALSEDRGDDILSEAEVDALLASIDLDTKSQDT